MQVNNEENIEKDVSEELPNSICLNLSDSTLQMDNIPTKPTTIPQMTSEVGQKSHNASQGQEFLEKTKYSGNKFAWVDSNFGAQGMNNIQW